MKKLLLLPLFCLLLNAQDKEELLKQAQEYEKKQDYKNAMLIYKKIAENKTIEFPKEEAIAIVEKPEIKPIKKNLNTIEDKETKSTIEQI